MTNINYEKWIDRKEQSPPFDTQVILYNSRNHKTYIAFNCLYPPDCVMCKPVHNQTEEIDDEWTHWWLIPDVLHVFGSHKHYLYWELHWILQNLDNGPIDSFITRRIDNFARKLVDYRKEVVQRDKSLQRENP